MRIFFSMLLCMALLFTAGCAENTSSTDTIDSNETGFLTTPENLRMAINQQGPETVQLPEYEVTDYPEQATFYSSYVNDNLTFRANLYAETESSIPVIEIGYSSMDKAIGDEDLRWMADCMEVIIGLVDPEVDAKETTDAIIAQGAIYSSEKLFYLYDSYETETLGYCTTFLATPVEEWIEGYYFNRDVMEEW
ncbi:MAG: hypothetical protein Q4C22_04785 [Bacillota bacterium]|nr:hypothetical protein [Bacillota bacterium]